MTKPIFEIPNKTIIMRKIAVIFSLVAGSFILAKCTPKAGKTISETPKPPTTDVATAPTSTAPSASYSEADITAGKTVYANNCAKCHKLYPTAEFTATQWKPILKGMIPKAKLSETDANLVRAYVYSNAKQG